MLLAFNNSMNKEKLIPRALDSPQTLYVRQKRISDMSDLTDKSEPYCLTITRDEVAANVLICLTNQAGYLLRKQI
jgi:hypothetical protein